MHDEPTHRPDPDAAPETPVRRAAPWPVFKSAVAGFFRHNAMNLSASLAFYTLLSFAPLLVLLVWTASWLGYDSQQYIIDQMASLAGHEAGMTVRGIFDSIGERPELGSVAGLVGVAVSLVGATTVFAQLQTGLNRIWGIRAEPRNAIWGWLRQRVLSVGVIAAAAFVLIVSLLISSSLGMILNHHGTWWDALNQVITTAVFAILFALLFRYLPDARMPWHRLLRGGIVTAILFAVGKWLIGYYLSSGEVGSAYGAASSLVVLLVWVYYSGAIFLFGAEVVRAWAVESGEAITPTRHAVRDE